MFTTDGTTCFASLTYRFGSAGNGAAAPAAFTRTGGFVSACACEGTILALQLDRASPSAIQIPIHFGVRNGAVVSNVFVIRVIKAPHKKTFCMGSLCRLM